MPFSGATRASVVLDLVPSLLLPADGVFGLAAGGFRRRGVLDGVALGSGISAVSRGAGLGSAEGRAIAAAGAALVMAMAKVNYFWIANVIYLGFTLWAVAGSAIKLVAYRRGL